MADALDEFMETIRATAPFAPAWKRRELSEILGVDVPDGVADLRAQIATLTAERARMDAAMRQDAARIANLERANAELRERCAATCDTVADLARPHGIPNIAETAETCAFMIRNLADPEAQGQGGGNGE